MKTNFLSVLANIFGLNRDKSKKANVKETSACELKTEESSEQDHRNGILFDIYFSLRYGRYSQALEKIQEYQRDFGVLNGNEKFFYEDGHYDGGFYVDYTIGRVLMKHQSPMTKDFFDKAVAGEMTEQESLVFEEKYNLQKRLLDAWERGDLIEFHQIVTKEGADVAHVYQGADYVGHFTLWDRVQERRKSDFYKYFVKYYKHLPNVHNYLEKELLKKQLTA